MRSFLEEVVDEVWKKHDVLEDLIFVLPSKRAGSFLKSSFSKTAGKTLFSPAILSIEAFVEIISGLTYASNTQLLFELYSVYLDQNPYEKDNFHDFSKWGQMLLQDFNELDRYLIAPDRIFSYLSDIQEINHWYVQAEKTPMMENYIRFWNNLQQLYDNFKERLIEKGIGHQGLIYRTASANLPVYLRSTPNKKHIFVGFNALNAAESYIIQEILSTTESDIFWDLDHYFVDDYIHDAGYFIRQHKKKWRYFEKKDFKGLSNHYLTTKDIRVVGVPKNVSQVKYVGRILEELYQEGTTKPTKAAVVLGDETLLNPLLNAVPETIEKVNITMGYPLQKTPLAGMFMQFFELYTQTDPRGWFYKNVLSFLSNSYIRMVLSDKHHNTASVLGEVIKRRNLVFINAGHIDLLEDTDKTATSLVFFDQKPTPHLFLDRCLELIAALKLKFEEEGNALSLEYLYHFYSLFNQLKAMLKMFPFVDDLKSLQSLFKELLSSETVDFQGEPLEGLQIMGMLESRNLDFETVIITSVNEGILPSGKSNNSFFPYDLKREFDLPTYKEKDAVYTYHFYRLIQRAKKVYLLYNTEADVLEGGEKSRFISQLLTDGNKLVDITQVTATPLIHSEFKTPQSIVKDRQLLAQLKSVAKNGLSPTSLSNYIRDPIAFYKKTILNIEEVPEVEETIAANTFGTVIHNVLEELYLPFVGSQLSPEKLSALKPKIETTVEKHFAKTYSNSAILSGKNLIAYSVVTRYIENFLEMEIEEAGKHQIKILAIEEKMKIALNLPEINYPIYLKGKLDRVDERDGKLRIIDYKTGNVNRTDVEIVDWNDLTTDYKHSKAFQLLCYALMHSGNKPADRLEAGIISFKNLKAGLLPFATKDKKGSRTRNTNIGPEILEFFRQQLFKLIAEIYHPDIPFEEKEV